MLALSRVALRARVVLGAVLALLVAALASGCGAEAQPSRMPQALSTPSDSGVASPTATPPVMPPAAEGTSPAAAKAFVRHWIATINYAMATGDTTGFEELNDPRCETCAAPVERIRHVYGAGGDIKSDGWSIVSLQLVPFQSPEAPIIDLGVRMTPQMVRESQNAQLERFRGGRLPLSLHLTGKRGYWQVKRLERAA